MRAAPLFALLPLALAWAAPLRIGDLICPQAPADSALPSCPVLYAGMTAGGKAHFIDADSRHYLLPPPAAYRSLGTTVSGRMQGALDTSLPTMKKTKNAGVLRPSESAALLMPAKAGRDTVMLQDTLRRLRSAPPAKTLTACLDSLSALAFHGHVSGAFLGEGLCDFTVAAYASLQPDTAKAPARPAALTRLFAAATPRWAGGTKSWIWADLMGEAGTFWLFRIPGKPDFAVFMDSTDMPEARAIRTADLDGDGEDEFLIESDHHYGDGSYSSLTLVRVDQAKPILRQAGISGSGGEPGAGTAQGDWWIAESGRPKAKRVYLSEARLGNENGTSHDLAIEAFEMAPGGSIDNVRAKAFPVVLFGRPGTRSQADSLVKSMVAKKPPALDAGLRPLPRLHGKSLAWQAGAVAPDLKTAQAWARWDKSGLVRTFKNAHKP